MSFVYRAARKDDALALARLWFISSRGILPYYFGGLKKGVAGEEIFQHQLAMEGSAFGYPRWRVAEVAGEVVGVMNVYTHEESALLKDIPLGRMLALGPVAMGRFVWRSYQLGDLLGLRVKGRLFSEMHHDHLPGSLYVNCLGVDERWQGRGIGAALLQWAREEAHRRGTDSLSLHVWGDNHRAMALYGRHGYAEDQRRFPVLPPAIRDHTEGKVHMVCPVVKEVPKSPS